MIAGGVGVFWTKGKGKNRAKIIRNEGFWGLGGLGGGGGGIFTEINGDIPLMGVSLFSAVWGHPLESYFP